MDIIPTPHLSPDVGILEQVQMSHMLTRKDMKGRISAAECNLLPWLTFYLNIYFIKK